MSIIRLKALRSLGPSRRCFSVGVQQEDEYVPVAQYPKILDTSYEAKQARKKEAKWKEIKDVKTVEEKQIKLNMPRYYGFKCYVFQEDKVPYNNLNLAQHITKTHLIPTRTLPEFYNDISVDGHLVAIKSQIEEALLIEYEGYKRNNTNLTEKQIEDALSSSIVKQLNRILINNLVEDNSHLLDTQVDYDARIEAFWYAGGMNPPLNVKKYRTGVEWRKHTEDDPVDRAIHYSGSPSVQLRNELPLPPIIPHSEASNPDFKVPFFKYDPRTVGTTTTHKHAANIAGYWPGEKYQFGLMSYHKRGHMLERNFGDEADAKEALHRQGILSSFGWLSAQANMLGFTTFNEITYPMVTQTVITDGQKFSFYLYQMNTILMNGDNYKENPLKNVCWAIPETELFEEIKDGKLVGFNDEVLKSLLKFYKNVPQERLGVNLRPYLAGEKIIANYSDDDKRNWLEREYKYLVSNRPRFKLDYEVYHWEKIYKIDHKTRPIEARRRPFELFVDPWKRTLDDRQPNYIPRKLRPDLPRHKGRYAKEYFP
ncbi:PREDICTED: 28S ribosomal protein S30, mitochondrial [Nicrophorus vespilloides]|uniref:28S ribosomal protein S30, mitochondrial n=1 Tax=Nicrophorus vespilloides TaxID=110193 RepID=A0ABM1NFW9_NICVS|nr:PREDICTED: 28S ribosomal protein S30, mitochondrial [Nicrophorus vespilloides]